MQVQKQYNISFMSKFLPNTIKNNANALKQKMESETVILKSKTMNQQINVRTLSINNGEAVFKDGKFLARRNKDNELIPYGKDTFLVEFGNVRIISDGSGKIIERKKPFYKKWSKIFEKADFYIKRALDNYNDKDIVQKQYAKKETLTKEGLTQAKKLMDIFNALNPFSKNV